MLVCSDSHTCSAGVFNCLARGVGGPDVFYAAIKGETWFRCGETVRYELSGRLPKAVTTKDAFLQIAGRHGAHATMNVEYGGPGIADLSINARKTLTTMSAELSAEFATFEPDDTLIDWVRSRSRREFEPVYPDSDAKYLAVREVELNTLEPLVAFPDTVVQNSRPVKDAAGTKIDQAYIGSCANGTIDDLELAASVVAGRRVAPGVRFIVTPASQLVYREAIKSGAMEKLADAGAMIAPPTCGACGGGHMGVIGPDEVCITATTRNFKGRMGDPSSKFSWLARDGRRLRADRPHHRSTGIPELICPPRRAAQIPDAIRMGLRRLGSRRRGASGRAAHLFTCSPIGGRNEICSPSLEVRRQHQHRSDPAECRVLSDAAGAAQIYFPGKPSRLGRSGSARRHPHRREELRHGLEPSRRAEPENLGLACLVAPSINGLFYRNAVNFAFPAMECEGVHELFEEGDVAKVDFASGVVENQKTGEKLTGRTIPAPLLKIVDAGGIFPLLEKEQLIAPRR